MYNLLVKSHKKEEPKPVEPFKHVITPQISGEITTTQNRFSQFQNYHETVSRPAEDIDVHTVPLHKNVSEAQSELVKRVLPTEEIRNQTPTKPPFTSSVASPLPNSGSVATDPLISASFIPDAPSSPVRRSSYTSSQARRSRYSDQKLDFVKEEIPERGVYEGYKADGQRSGHGTLYFSDGGKY